MWRFSKKDIGNRIRCRNRRAPNWNCRTFWTTKRTRDRTAVVAVLITISRPKPRASTISRSTSPRAITSSIVSCMYRGAARVSSCRRIDSTRI